MILIAPDKFKGTLTAEEVSTIMAEAFTAQGDTFVAPMADGGEGTARIIAGSQPGWECRSDHYYHPETHTAVIDSSALIGHTLTQNILDATSAPLGRRVGQIIDNGAKKIIIGIGGTMSCDGGIGFADALAGYDRTSLQHTLVGVSDVEVPLVADGDMPSALMFAPQKGATAADMPILRARLEKIYAEYKCRSPYDGAGGGLGFAIASIIGARCYRGAEYILRHYDIDWSKISMIVSGEGKIDNQTSQGKVVGTLREIARRRGIPFVAFGGTVDPHLRDAVTISTDTYFPDLPLDTTTAAMRLQAAVNEFVTKALAR